MAKNHKINTYFSTNAMVALNNPDFLPLQIVRQCHFHDAAKYKKISPQESKNIEEFWSK